MLASGLRYLLFCVQDGFRAFSTKSHTFARHSVKQQGRIRKPSVFLACCAAGAFCRHGFVRHVLCCCSLHEVAVHRCLHWRALGEALAMTAALRCESISSSATCPGFSEFACSHAQVDAVCMARRSTLGLDRRLPGFVVVARFRRARTLPVSSCMSGMSEYTQAAFPCFQQHALVPPVTSRDPASSSMSGAAGREAPRENRSWISLRMAPATNILARPGTGA